MNKDRVKKMTTNLSQFPSSMHHLIKHVLKHEKRRLYSVGRIGDLSNINIEQIRLHPYEILQIRVVAAGRYAGSTVHIDFRNKTTKEIDETSLWDGGEDIIEGLEKKLGIAGNEDSQTQFWKTGDRALNNSYLRRFRQLEVTGAAVEYSPDGNIHHRLFGIFLD